MRGLVLLSLLVTGCIAVRYDGYETIRITPRNADDQSWLQILESSIADKMDIWQSGKLDLPMDIMVPPHFQAEIKEILAAKHIPYHVMIQDVQGLIDSQARKDVDVTADFDYTSYHTYAEIQQWVLDMEADYPSIISSFVIATTSEGRDVRAIKLGGQGGSQTKKAIYWQGGIHAREWISPATVMWIAKAMADDYNVDPDVTAAMDAFDFYIVPSLNGDGYAYTWTNDRLWRKTRSANTGFCVGTDGNRNYEFEWGGEGASTSPCSDTYRGPSAGSELCVKGTTEFLLELAETVDVVNYIDFHAYSQLFLSPWAYSARALLPSDTGDHDIAGEKFAAALEDVYGTKYVTGPTARVLYAASGSSIDWGYETLGAKYSYVVELRDEGRYGFLLPADQIEPSGIETYAAVKALVVHMYQEYFP